MLMASNNQVKHTTHGHFLFKRINHSGPHHRCDERSLSLRCGLATRGQLFGPKKFMEEELPAENGPNECWLLGAS